MQKPVVQEAREKLIRLQANRRGTTVDLRVHYEVKRQKGCDTYQIITVDKVN
jgi:hypothetical protein